MSFLSIEFAFIFCVFFIIYWLFGRWTYIQNFLLLLAGYTLLISFDWRFALILFVFSSVIYLSTYWIRLGFLKNRHSKRRIRLSLVLCIIPLLVFKYFDFFREQAQQALSAVDLEVLLPVLPILLPIGISFYTFNAVTYLVSVYRRQIKPVSFFQVLLFLSFFPVLIAGPICRATQILPQFTAIRRNIADPNRIAMLIVLALIKKLWLASYLAEVWVDPIFANPTQYNSLEIIAASYAYALQIYFDFSGYTDLVTALALMLGIQIPINFNAPYYARNLKVFWQRWHISLSTWIRDYIYIPLGGNHKGFWHTQWYLLIAMLLSGLWHGAAIHFIIWGAIHALGVILLNVLDSITHKKFKNKIPLLMAQCLTIHYVCFAWIFFRVETWEQAMDILKGIVLNFKHISLTTPAIGFITILFLLFLTQSWWIKLPQKIQHSYASTPYLLKPLWITFCLLIIIIFAPAGIPPFIYAQF